jgi:prepilin-type N-terminal cleavage/methylation domain-containing protein
MRGFSLIELMITIGLVALLSTLGMASYSRYIIRSTVTEALGFFARYQTDFAAMYSAYGTLPTQQQLFPSNTAIALDSNGDVTGTCASNSSSCGVYISSPNINYIAMGYDNSTNMRLYIKFSSTAPTGLANLFLEMGGRLSNGTWAWTCGTFGTGASFVAWNLLPETCRNDLWVLGI